MAIRKYGSGEVTSVDASDALRHTSSLQEPVSTDEVLDEEGEDEYPVEP